MKSFCIFLFILKLAFVSRVLADNHPIWTDPKTGHIIRRLTTLNDGNYGTLYFHQEVFTDDGRQMIFVGKHGAERRLYVMDWPSGISRKLTQEASDNEVLAPKSKRVFFTRGRQVYAIGLNDSHEVIVANLPADWDKPVRLSVNADETMLASAEAQGLTALKKRLGGGRLFDEMFAAHLTNRLFTIQIANGKVQLILETNAWLGHVQFSPTDKNLLMFCHEGPWAQVDRIWLTHTDGSELKLAYHRQVKDEIAGHEFWSADGKFIWFDNPFPARTNTSLSRVDAHTLAVTRFSLPPSLASVHFNRSPVGGIFSAEGSAQNKQISLLHLKSGSLKSEPLVEMANHRYEMEPDTHFSPDGKWIIFHSNQESASLLYAVATER